MNLHESAMSLLCISLHAQRVANWKRWLWPIMGTEFKLRRACWAWRFRHQTTLTSNNLSNAMLWPNMVKSVSLQQHCRTFRVKKSCTLQESVKNNEHLVSFVLLLRLLVMRVMLASLRFPMNSLRQWLMTSLTCQCPNDPKWIQMATHPSEDFRFILDCPPFCSVLFGSCALCTRPCKCGCAFTQHSVLKRKQKVKHCPNELLRFLPGFAGTAISISQIQSDLTHHIFTNSGRFWSYTGLDHPGPLTLKKNHPPIIWVKLRPFVQNSSWFSISQIVPKSVQMCRVNLSSTDLTLQLVQIGRFLTRSSLCRNLKFCQHCMQGQNFDLGWDRRWAWNQDCHSMSQHVTACHNSQGQLANQC